jgi:hypothetical protein
MTRSDELPSTLRVTTVAHLAMAAKDSQQCLFTNALSSLYVLYTSPTPLSLSAFVSRPLPRSTSLRCRSDAGAGVVARTREKL